MYVITIKNENCQKHLEEINIIFDDLTEVFNFISLGFKASNMSELKFIVKFFG